MGVSCYGYDALDFNGMGFEIIHICLTFLAFKFLTKVRISWASFAFKQAP